MSAEAEHLLRVFGAREDIYAVGMWDGTNVVYRPVQQSLTIELLDAHLAGDLCIGAYQLSLANTVSWLGWDVDAPSLEQAQQRVRALLNQLGALPQAVEYSGSKGYHVLISLLEPMPAEKAKTLVARIKAQAGVDCEAFPKQTRLTSSNALGSLLKVPGGLHPRTQRRSIFVDPDNGWESGPALSALEALRMVTVAELEAIFYDPTPEDNIIATILPFWSGGQRHHIALALAGFLANTGWPSADTEHLVARLCDHSNDTETTNRLQAVHDTYKRAAAGERVAGLSLLADLVPGTALRQLLELASSAHVEPGVRRLDGIRLIKRPGHLKVKLAADLIWSELAQRGRWVQTAEGVYFLDAETHQLHPFAYRPEAGSTALKLLQAVFRFNVIEGFGSQTYHDLVLQAANTAPEVRVHRRSWWDGTCLHINLGGPEVYVLDGAQVTRSWNGESGIFLTTHRPIAVTIPLDGSIGTARQLLVDNLNLASSTNAPASPAQQRELLWAWLLSVFFPELMKTKPLPIALGPAGSGKTSAMRRLLRVVEGLDADVLEIIIDKPDALRAAITNSHMLVLDNLERSGARWLPDTLNRIATGSEIVLRQLYSTNTEVRFRPQCYLAMTAISVPFSDESVFDRMLPLEFQRLQHPLPENWLQSELVRNYSLVWADLLQQLNLVVRALQGHIPQAQDHRLADFADFCAVLTHVGAPKELLEGLGALSRKQQGTLAANSKFVDALELWLDECPEEAARPHTISELFNELRARSQIKHMEWIWSSAKGLATHIAVLEPILLDTYNCIVSQAHDGRQGRTVKTYSFPRGALGETLSGES